jgi:hypothetical protein
MSSDTTQRFFLHHVKNPIAIDQSNYVEREVMFQYVQSLIGVHCRAVKVNVDKTTNVSLYNAFLDCPTSKTYTQVLNETPDQGDFYNTLCNNLWAQLESDEQHATATIYMVDPDYHIVYEVEITLQGDKYTITTFHPDA